ncbi:MAG: Transketolase domain protein [Bacteriovoracaceae bacterium]|nr:Transketolase domain protein [Bacteriovoracaceae bacterium]
MKELNPKKLRKTILDFAYYGQSVHIPSAFSIVEILSTLYSKILTYSHQDPASEKRDFFILSKGHGVMALYACFIELGWLNETDIKNYFHDGSRLRGLAEADIPGLEVSGGSLGHGLPVATGMALGLKKREDARKIICLVGDGEMNEGGIWEALLFAAHHKLDNLLVIVDANQFQAMGRVEEILSLESLPDKFRSFGFDVLECDGHESSAIENSIQKLFSKNKKPKALIARTLKGKGVSFIEGQNAWHYTRLTKETYEAAGKELSLA